MTTRSDLVGAPDPASAAGAPMTAPGARPRAACPRPAEPADVPEILRLIRALAEYERSLDHVTATEDLIADLLFGGNTPSGAPAAHCHVIDADAPGTLAGFALWFLNASTWLGRHGIYLEDLYVDPDYRGRGYGQALMAELARVCTERGYGRLEWWVLDWNTPAIGFYESLGAAPMAEWTVHRLTGDALIDLARGAAVAGGAPAPST